MHANLSNFDFSPYVGIWPCGQNLLGENSVETQKQTNKKNNAGGIV